MNLQSPLLVPNWCEVFPSGIFPPILRRPWEEKTPMSVAQDMRQVTHRLVSELLCTWPGECLSQDRRSRGEAGTSQRRPSHGHESTPKPGFDLSKQPPPLQFLFILKALGSKPSWCMRRPGAGDLKSARRTLLVSGGNDICLQCGCRGEGIEAPPPSI